MNFLKSRRSIRKFKPDPVPRELLLKAIDTARFAPSARNSQPWRFIVIEDKELIRKLVSIHPWAKPLEEAPLAVAVVCNIDESPTSYMLDCANATVYFLLAIHALGLGGVWIQTLRNIDEIRDVLGLPSSVVPIAIIPVGYPDETPSPRPRKPISEIIYVNKYGYSQGVY